MQPGLNIAFAGTPAFAAHILETLLNERTHTISCVYTQPDKPAGRGRKIQKSPVKELAETYKLLVRQPENRQQLQLDDDLGQLDVLVVAAYGMLIPGLVLKRPRFGCINIHTSLLPRWRGAAPVQWAILAGDVETGITIMQMDAGLDTGDILYQQSCPIHPTDTAGILFESLAVIGSDCLLKTLHKISLRSVNPVRQPEAGVSYAHKIQKSDALIDWHRSAIEIDRQIRAFNPEPVAFTILNTHMIRIWQAEILDIQTREIPPGTVLNFSAAGLDITTNDKVIRIMKLQLPGKQVMDCRDFFNGNPRFWSTM